jgi:hypothetical protein
VRAPAERDAGRRGAPRRGAIRFGVALALAACGETPFVERPSAPTGQDVYNVVNGCYSLDATAPGSSNTRWLVADTSEGVPTYSFTGLSDAEGARFRLRAADLGTYLLYDAEANYLSYAEGSLHRVSQLQSDVLLRDDDFRSPAEWDLEVSATDPTRFQLRHHQTGRYLTRGGVTERERDAAVIALYPQDTSECREFPELALDAEGEAALWQWPDGDVYGVVDTHSHLLTNFGFGGSGMFHGAPFHRLGVEHALPSCEPFHGAEGRKDLIGYAFAGNRTVDADAILALLAAKETPEFNHDTAGYPDFTDWPSSWAQATHQVQYYVWLQRAYLAGLRLVVQHATTNSVLCELMLGLGAPGTRYSCDDMTAVDRQLDEVYRMERYIDAQQGGPGRGWFRIVTSPQQAREVIGDRKLAVILGIETSNLFGCFLTPRFGYQPCTADSVRRELARYYDRGVRAIFPTHKFDNAFSAGDGDRRVSQLGSFINSGHFSNFVLDCPDVPAGFDGGDVPFGGLNKPRQDYLEPAPNDMSGFVDNPLRTLAPFLSELRAPPLVGDYCQNAGLTELGETLVVEMMKRGMLIEVDHLPRWGYARAYELLAAADYPAVGSHGRNNRGRLYQLGGVSNTGFGSCGSPDTPGAMANGFRARLREIADNGGFAAEGFGFDFNGFAGGRRPRFGEDSTCAQPQANPITYPFRSFAGDVTFTQPRLGSRVVDFNTEGMLHIGLLPELVEDVRRDGTADDGLEPLFRSAEGYIRFWERAELRAAALASGQ